MNTANHTVSASATIPNRVRASALLVLSILFLGVSSASALPRANLQNCNSNWVNNPGANKCVDEGQQDLLSGRPVHYVACLSDGTLFCCVTNAQGGQDCDAIEDKTLGTRSILGDLQLSVELGGQQTTNLFLGQIQEELNQMQTQLNNLSNQCGGGTLQ